MALYESEVLQIHNALHNPSMDAINVRGVQYEIKTNKSNCRNTVVLGHKIMQQNMKKMSKYTELAKQGHKITWVVSTYPWGLVIDNKIDQWCDAFLKDPVKQPQQQQQHKTTLQNTPKSLSLTQLPSASSSSPPSPSGATLTSPITNSTGTLSSSGDDSNGGKSPNKSPNQANKHLHNKSNSTGQIPSKKGSDGPPLCMYGEKCYRKNPQHFKEFRHPHLGKISVTTTLTNSTTTTSSNNNNNSTSMEIENVSNNSINNNNNNSNNNNGPHNKKQKLNSSQHNTQPTNNDNNSSSSSNNNTDSGMSSLSSSTPAPVVSTTTTSTLTMTMTKKSKGNNPYELDSALLQQGGIIGQGAFGIVKEGQYKGERVAIKILQGIADKKAVDMFQQEGELLCKLNHCNIVKCMGVCFPSDDDPTIERLIVMEFLPRDLKQLIRQYGGLVGALPVPLFLNIAKGVAEGIAYLHNCTPPIIHRDLKPANILLDGNHVPKIADFGISREKLKTATMTKIGTPHYMAPEILQAKKYSEKVDVYSYGMILFQMVTGKPPFAGMGADGEKLNPLQIIMKATVENIRPQIPNCCPPPISQLIQRCWDKDPSQRPALSYIISWLQKMIDGGCDMSAQPEKDELDETLPFSSIDGSSDSNNSSLQAQPTPISLQQST